MSGLLIERAQVEVVQPDYFGPALSVEEILQKVAKEAGLDAAVALARAFKLDPKDYDFEPVAEPAPVASTPSRLGYSQRLIEERRPISNGRKREV